MLPDVLYSRYLEYKRDTDSIASWLASTAKAAGFDATRLGGASAQSEPNSGGKRLKGKARKEEKKDTPRIDPAASPKYKIRIADFATLAEFLLEKAVPVPQSFSDTLNHAIAVRSGFGGKLE